MTAYHRKTGSNISASGDHQPYRGNMASTDSTVFARASSQPTEDTVHTGILPMPKDVSYTLQGYHEDKPISGSLKIKQFAWQSSDDYKALSSKVDGLQREVQQEAEQGHIVRLVDISLIIVGHDHEYSACISGLAALKESTIQQICGFVFKHPRCQFRLKYYVHFSSTRTEIHKSGERWLEMVRKEVRKNINTSFRGQEFIPKIVRDQFTSREIISSICSEELDCSPSDVEAKMEHIIQAKATGIFLACVTSDQQKPISIFFQLFPRYTDEFLPPIPKNDIEIKDDVYDRVVKQVYTLSTNHQ